MRKDERVGMPEAAVWQDVRDAVERIAVPAEKLDAAVERGLEKARRRRRSGRRMRVGAGAASLLLLASLLSIRFSPAVAAYVGDIPGLDSVVQWIRGDKGIRLALEHDFMQPIGLGEQHGGVELTIDGLVADESRVLLFYSIADRRGHPEPARIIGVDLTDGSGLPLNGYGLGYGTPDYGPKPEDGIGRGSIDITFQEGSAVPDAIKLGVKLATEEQAAESRPLWNYTIPIDRGKFEGLERMIAVNQAVTIEGQRIRFGTMTVLPTRIGLEVAYDPANTKHIFGFDDLEIVDEAGNVFGTIANGVSATYKDEHTSILYFQSNYFTEPRELYLRASSLRALDKGKLEVRIDLENERLLTKPDDRLRLEGIAAEGSDIVLDFRLANDDSRDANRSYGIFASRFVDSSGAEFYSAMSGSSEGEIQYHLPAAAYRSPLTLTIDNYPTRIEADLLLRIQ